MNPSDICDWTESYFDELLDEANVEQYEKHLSKCPSCQVELQAFRELDATIAAAWNCVELPNLDLASIGRSNSSVQLSKSVRSGRNTPPLQWLPISLAVLALIATGIVASSWLLNGDGENKIVFDSPAENLPGSSEPNNSNEASANSSLTEKGDDSKQLFAKAQFSDATLAVPVSSQKSYTIYQVIPKITYSEIN